jgi:hypothetical protein
MKQFDFEHEYFKRQSPQKQEWIKANHDKPITEDEYILVMQKLRKYATHPKASQRYSRSAARSAYRSLKNNYGFFK